MKNNSIVIKPDHSSGSYNQAFGSKYLTTSFSAEWVTGWNPLWGQTSSSSWILHRGQVPNADLICFSSYFFRWSSVGTFHGGNYLNDVIRTQSSFHTSSKIWNRVDRWPELCFISAIGFSFCGFYRFFCWKPAPVHITSTHCQVIIQEYRFSGSLQQLESMSNLG